LLTPEVNKQLTNYSEDDNKGGWGTSEMIAMGVGCTAVVALITPTEIYVANAGDSRAVACLKSGSHKELSFDHKPDNPDEKKRIEDAGGFVEENRVKGILNLSRSLGDCEYKSDKALPPNKQMITAFPEINKMNREEAKFLILACDGIWDCMTNQQAVDFVNGRLKTKSRVSEIIEEMFEKNIAEDIHSSNGIGCDNMTCVIVEFKS